MEIFAFTVAIEFSLSIFLTITFSLFAFRAQFLLSVLYAQSLLNRLLRLSLTPWENKPNSTRRILRCSRQGSKMMDAKIEDLEY